MARLSIHLLGTFQVALDSEPIAGYHAETAQALLAYLAMHAGSLCRRASLAGLLWSEYDQSSALTNLRQALRRLRTAIGDRNASPPFLLVTRTTIAFNPESDYVLDVDAFTRALDAVRSHAHRSVETCATCAERLAEAVELYEGEFLAGFSLDSALFEEWMVVERERLHGKMLEALGHLAAYHETQGAYEESARYARRALALEPWREEAHRVLMRALALSGQRSAALAQYEECRDVLREELGVEPSEETTQLYERIRDGGELPGTRSLGEIGSLHNLPAQLTPFIGRERELAEIAGRLADPNCRLLTLVGPGGSGKTRLALEAAARELAHYPHGVFFVQLAPLSSVEAIVPTAARALSFSFYGTGDPMQQLLNYLRQKSMLLLLDNFEHLVEGASITTRILSAAPEVKVLVTSRTRLGVQGEHLYPVAGMRVPTMAVAGAESVGTVRRYSAVQLFLSDALRARPDLEPTAEDMGHIVHICRLVEGMPLAIALAATWMQMLAPAEIAAEIERSMDILEADMRDAPARQRSMRATFDHSWSLLSAWEQEVLAGLSAFRSGFTRGAAEHVTGASLRELMALVNASLLQRTPAGRYEIHELLRQYAAGRLARSPDEGERAHEQHCAYYAAMLQRLGMELRGGRQRTALEEIEAEVENARAAWNWAVARGRATPLDRMADGLGGFFEWHKRCDEGASAFGAANEALQAVSSANEMRVLVKILTWQGFFAEQRGEIDSAQDLWQRSLAILDTPMLEDLDTRPERASALDHLGWSMRHRGQREAKGLLEQSLETYRALGDRWGTAGALLDLGSVVEGLGELHQAQDLLQESVAIYHELGDRRLAGWAYLWWGFSAMTLGQMEKAEQLARASIADFREAGDPFSVRTVHHLLNSLLREDGRYAEAQALAEENLAFFRDVAEPQQVTYAMSHLGECELHLGGYESVYELAQEYLALSQELGYRRHIGPACVLAGQVALAQEAWSEAHEWLQRGTLANEQVGRHVIRCSDLAGLAQAAIGLGQLAEARQYLQEAFEKAAEGELLSQRLAPVVAAAALFADEGQAERAVELYALASRYPHVSNSRWYEDVAGKHITASAAELPAEVVVAAQERGRARDLDAAVEELLAEWRAPP